MKTDFERELEREVDFSRKLWNSTTKLNDITIREIFATRHEVNSIRDSKGMPIHGTGRIITNEEKKMIFDYIIENNYPLTARMYNFLIKSYIDGELVLENQEKSRKL